MGLGKRLLVLLGLWALGVAMVLLALAPSWPRSAGGWIALVVLGPLAAFALEWTGEKLFSPKVGRRISEAPFSIARILYAVAVVLIGAALVGLALGLAALKLEPWLRRIGG